MKNKAVYPMPRSSLLLLLATVGFAIAPHILRLPLWLPVVAVACVGWRIQVYRERWVFPSRIVRFSIVVASMVAIFLYYGTVIGPDAGVALLILAYLFKLLEMYKERDAFLIAILSYFVIATNYLFSTALLSTLYTMIVVLFVTASLVGLNQSPREVKPKRTLGIAAKLFVQAIPIMIVLFVFVPRVSPMWALNIDNGHAKTGLSDSVSPGDISNLSKSPALAFTVEFFGDKPAQKDLYWRGVTYVDFDGRTWRRGSFEGYSNAKQLVKSELVVQSDTFKYRVIMEPNYRHWLFALPYSIVNESNVKQTKSLVLTRKESVSSLVSYEVVSHPKYSYQGGGLNAVERERNTQLPSTDIRAKRKAKEMFGAAKGDPHTYAESILRWFNKDNFVYTLKPPLLRINVIDGFLFSSQQGFCAHYAGAFVFMMRAVGIPARMVGGYQGGEYHEAGHLMVRQYHAHAWAEVWFQGRGWVRVDPTAAVAPERVLSGPDGAVTDDSFSSDSPLSPLLFRNSPFFRGLRAKMEHVDFLWSRWVVGYNNSTQTQFLSRWMDNVTPQKIVMVMFVFLGGVMLVLAVYILLERRRKKLDPVDVAYLRFGDKLANKGVERKSGEGVWSYCERASLALPNSAEDIHDITQLYDDIRYGRMANENIGNRQDVGGTLSQRQKKRKAQFKQKVRSLRLKL